MTEDTAPKDRETYYREAASWSHDRQRAQRRAQKVAWIIAGTASIIALFEAVAIVALTPLKTVVPYTLLVDRETGYVEALKPLDKITVSPDRALTRSFLAQYVIAREGFDIDSLRSDYRKVALWSSGDARDRYLASMQASNPLSPLATLPRRALIDVTVKSISSLSDDTSLVRFSTVRSDPGAQDGNPANWAAVVRWRYSGAEMSADDRLLNPLGFQVVRYRKDAESLPDPAARPSADPELPGSRPSTGPLSARPASGGSMEQSR